ncbi:hypothetical protein OG594_08810 [Streptomyces sp. NBC_01214]|uniref:hypothetical protein n=1 Tax=Streptomyces sp. NBC_01214 TaxID=2903777 RepID=UPI002254D852|nr:hypothetical protein [Streptomyces sp. NBC_01214]MCX4801750.1 hypothetical protein [Streptomyces sp. NBC_01214]
MTAQTLRNAARAIAALLRIRRPRPASQVPPCRHCGKPIRDAVYYEQHADGLHAWHTDRPDCWNAALEDGQP